MIHWPNPATQPHLPEGNRIFLELFATYEPSLRPALHRKTKQPELHRRERNPRSRALVPKNRKRCRRVSCAALGRSRLVVPALVVREIRAHGVDQRNGRGPSIHPVRDRPAFTHTPGGRPPRRSSCMLSLASLQALSFGTWPARLQVQADSGENLCLPASDWIVRVSALAWRSLALRN